VPGFLSPQVLSYVAKRSEETDPEKRMSCLSLSLLQS
jgi:hypothetical protein